MKGRRTDLSQTQCATSRALEVVGDWWSLLIVRDALGGLQRFGEFQKSIGLAKNILAARLKKLVDNGVLRVEPDGASAARTKYVLTESGKRLAIVIAALWQWGEENCFQPGESKVVLTDKATDQPFAKMELKTADGRSVDLSDIQLSLKARETAASS